MGNKNAKGSVRSEEYREKQRLSQLGKPSGNFRVDAKYSALHMWMKYHYGTPNECEFCGSTEAKRYEWANKSGRYERNRNDWLRLCKSCHAKYDRVGYKSWIKRREVLGL